MKTKLITADEIKRLGELYDIPALEETGITRLLDSYEKLLRVYEAAKHQYEKWPDGTCAKLCKVMEALAALEE